MTERITSVGGVDPVDRRESERRERDRRADRRALIPTEAQAETFEPEPAPARAAVHMAPGLGVGAGAAVFAAQQMGQKGQKRGLRGGPPVLDAARAAYLGTEYSGEAERRPAVGQAKKTDI